VNANEPPAANRPASPPRSAEATEAAIEVSLEALRTAAETMRGARPVTRDLPAPQSSAKAAAPRTPPAPEATRPSGEARSSKEFGVASPPRREPAPAVSSSPAVQARLAALTDAITAGRVDVLLEPILGLEDQRARHFEVSVRLRGTAGEALDAPRADAQLRGTGLLPMLDCVSIARTAQVARRLADRGRPGAVLSSLSAEALGHDAFLNEIADAYRAHDRFADQLVLAFSQGDVRALAPHEWETLADMRDLGFRFALQAVTDLDMDFDSLKTKGFSFVKLEADVFLEGMPAPGGPLPAADICRHLAQLGLTLIVGGIDDETKLARIFGFGALLGQGQMFGGPRPVKAEALGPHPAAA
jgi:cyclic-di-GMP phosphodiesterase, flagellum assembly factor TipF